MPSTVSRALFVVALLPLTAAPAFARKPPRDPAPAAPASPGADGGTKVIPLSPELRAEMDRTAALGLELYAHDKAAALASDALAPWLQHDPRVGSGWVTAKDDEGVRVIWATKPDAAGRRQGLYSWRIVFASNRILTNVPDWAEGATLPEPFALEDGELARLRALDALAQVKIDPQWPSYNPVVIGAGEGLAVYLVPSTTDPKAKLVGGLIEIPVAADGTPGAPRYLSKTVNDVGSGAPAGATGMVGVISELGPHPTESHVYSSLNYGIPLMVVCAGSSWYVSGASVEQIELPSREK